MDRFNDKIQELKDELNMNPAEYTQIINEKTIND